MFGLVLIWLFGQRSSVPDTHMTISSKKLSLILQRWVGVSSLKAANLLISD